MLKCFKNVIAGNPEMVCVTHTHPARPGFCSKVHGDAIRVRTDDQTKAIVSIDISGACSRADHLQLGSGINSSFLEQFEIGMQTGDAVRIYAAQVGIDQQGSERQYEN